MLLESEKDALKKDSKSEKSKGADSVPKKEKNQDVDLVPKKEKQQTSGGEIWEQEEFVPDYEKQKKSETDKKPKVQDRTATPTGIRLLSYFLLEQEDLLKTKYNFSPRVPNKLNKESEKVPLVLLIDTVQSMLLVKMLRIL